MNSKIHDAIPAELNAKLKNAKLSKQKNDVKFTTLLTPFSDSIEFLSIVFFYFFKKNLDFTLFFWRFFCLFQRI